MDLPSKSEPHEHSGFGAPSSNRRRVHQPTSNIRCVRHSHTALRAARVHFDPSVGSDLDANDLVSAQVAELFVER
jgi:hypothetical protein